MKHKIIGTLLISIFVFSMNSTTVNCVGIDDSPNRHFIKQEIELNKEKQELIKLNKKIQIELEELRIEVLELEKEAIEKERKLKELEEQNKQISLGTFQLTAYCSCEKCCSSYAKNRPVDEHGNKIITGSIGTVLQQGVSIAVDPNVIPYNATVIVNGHEYIAHDTGGAIKGNRIDVYFSNHQSAVEFGVQSAEVFIKK